MILTEKEKQSLEFFANSKQSYIFVNLLKKIVSNYADVRNIKDKSTEGIKGAEIACNIIEIEIINRLTLNKNNLETEITEEYE